VTADRPAVPATARGFDRAVAAYDAARPGYPPAAVAQLCAALELGPGRRVLDLGAGTGKLTVELLRTGADVVAVEPLPGMRARLAASLHDARLEVVAGAAEHLPLPDASLDGAVAAQSFHWFDAPVALRELHRVLRPGTTFAVLFNRRDLTTPVQAALDELLAPHRGETPSWAHDDWIATLDGSPRFAAPELSTYAWTQHLDTAGLVARVASISFVAQLDGRVRTRILATVRDLADRGDRDEHGHLALHYVTELRLLARRDLAP